jgi:hypothetical protein
MWNHNEVAEETNLLASYVGTKTEDESDSANLVLIDFFNREVIATWPRYRDHLAQMPPQVYSVEEPPIRLFLAELDKRYGSTRAWALSNSIGSEALSQLEQGLLTVR